MKKIGLLLTAILLSPLAMAQTAPATPKAQAPQTTGGDRKSVV